MKYIIILFCFAFSGCTTLTAISGDKTTELSVEDYNTMINIGDKYKVDSIIYFRDYSTEISTSTK